MPKPGGPYTNPNVVAGHSPDTPVNFQTWLWIDAASWKTQAVTATAGGVSATTTAIPVDVVFDMGDGHSVTCTGPGAVYDTSQAAAGQHTSCSYSYRRSTDGRGPYQVSATMSWKVAWTSNVGQAGALPALTTTSTGSLNVDQIESVNVGA